MVFDKSKYEEALFTECRIAPYFYRTMERHDDSSLGTIKISPNELRALLIKTYKEGKEHEDRGE